MLTVKHIEENGNESLYACERVLYINKGEQFEDGLYLDPPYTPGLGLSAEGVRRVLPISRCGSSGNPEPMAFVMNGNGATIAKYRM